MEGHLSERLNSKENRLLLLDYLIAELMAARMIRVNKPHLHKGIELKLVCIHTFSVKLCSLHISTVSTFPLAERKFNSS